MDNRNSDGNYFRILGLYKGDIGILARKMETIVYRHSCSCFARSLNLKPQALIPNP